LISSTLDSLALTQFIIFVGFYTGFVLIFYAGYYTLTVGLIGALAGTTGHLTSSFF
jgi:hypothetical protein